MKTTAIGNLAMKTLIHILMLVLLTVCSQAQVYPNIKDGHFPTEKEVNDFLKVGLDKKAVVAKFGEPLTKDTDQDGVETYDYPKPPDKIPKEEHDVYGDFKSILSEIRYLALTLTTELSEFCRSETPADIPDTLALSNPF